MGNVLPGADFHPMGRIKVCRCSIMGKVGNRTADFPPHFSTIQVSTQYLTSTTTWTSYSQPTETSIVQSWCTVAEKLSSDSSASSTATSMHSAESATSTSSGVPSEQKAVSTNTSALDSSSSSSSQSDTSAKNVGPSSELQRSSLDKEERKVPSRLKVSPTQTQLAITWTSTQTASQAPSHTDGSTASQTVRQTATELTGQTLSAATIGVTSASPALSARQNVENNCAWTTVTQWTTSQPSSTVITSEVIATSTVWNTVTTWLPTDIVQACTPAINVAETSSFSSGSSGWILPLPSGTQAASSATNQPIVLTWTDAATKYMSPLLSTMTPASNGNAQTGPLSTATVQPSQSVDDINVATESSTGKSSSSAASTENSSSRNSSASAKAGWVCGTFGVLLILGLLVWLYLRRRKHVKRNSQRVGSPGFGEKSSFVDSLADEKSDELEATNLGFHAVPLMTGQNSQKVQMHRGVSMPGQIACCLQS